MTELPRGRVCHLTTGRLRVKIPEKRNDPAFFDRVEERLCSWNSVDRVETNPLTGSVLVFFSDLAQLFFDHQSSNDLFSIDPDDFVAETAGLAEHAVGFFECADKRVQDWTGGAANLRTAIFLSLLLGGVYQVLRGNIAAPGATLLWYAGSALRLWDHAPSAQRKAAVGPSG
jgi:hypothetical protein